MDSAPAGPLPVMESMADAIAISRREKDPYFTTAFAIECWLDELTRRTEAQYADADRIAVRQLQTGRAVRLFQKSFGHTPDGIFHHLFHSLSRFAGHEHPQSQILRQGLRMMLSEQPADTWPSLTPPLGPDEARRSVAFMRSFVTRLCVWTEAFVHARVHLASSIEFSRNPSAALAEFGDFWRAWREGGTPTPPEPEPRWRKLGRPTADDPVGIDRSVALNQLLILLWPLVLRHQWSFIHLTEVVRSLAPPAPGHPFDDERSLANHCSHVLGLRKVSKPGSAPDDPQAGLGIVHALCGLDAAGSAHGPA